MCGIAGIVNYSNTLIASGVTINGMTEVIHHRGPDNRSHYLSRHNHVGHTRLSIIDLTTGDQPIFNRDKTVGVVFNGEIYNHIELKSTYLKEYPFYTKSDTEVIIALYEKFGIDFIKYLNGQFSIALFDENIKRTFLIRDRVGIAPLYFTQRQGTHYYASEIKSLLTVREITAKLDFTGFSEFIHLWTALTPGTLFEGIKEVSPGCYLEISAQTVKQKRYWDFDYQPDTTLNLSETIEELDFLLRDSVSIRLRSDVPVGAYLSGGLDSSIILSYLSESGKDLNTFSLTFSDEELNERKFQEEVSSYFSTKHHSVNADYQLIADNFLKTIYHTETPVFRTSPVPMMLLSQRVHDAGYKVVLTGEGADEVFGGYDIFKEAKIRYFWSRNPASIYRPLLLKKMYPYLDISKIKSSDYLKQAFGHNLNKVDDLLYSFTTRARTTSSIKDFLTEDVKQLINTDMEKSVREAFPIEPGQYNVFNTAQYIESKTIMPGYILSSQGDRMLMSNSVEGRYPFLDHRVIEFAQKMNNRFKMQGLKEKYILKQMAKNRLPASVLNRPKQPYRAPDVKSLLCSDKSHLLDFLSESEIKKNGLFDYRRVNMLVKKAVSGKARSAKDNMLFTNILSTQVWMDKFINN